ncbi:MAG TPA: glycosyltransferase family A protein [Dermatophilaceae bacterium]|nr:glycosyltransferase family A protein [Dermatophilaceae bacterium]
MSDDRIGIVIPTFNRTLVIEAAESAAAALGSAEHVVVVDDGSTSRDALAALDQLRERGFTVHRQPNRGVAAARNAGLALLRTPYALALDSDDRMGPDAPGVAADILDADPDAVIVAGVGIEFTDDGACSEPLSPGAPTRDSMRHAEQTISNPSAFRVADWRRCGGYPEGLLVGEDWVFWMRLLKDGGHIVVTDTLFLHRRLHPGQVSERHIDPRERIKSTNLMLREQPDLYLAHPDELVDELIRLRETLAAYRHAYRHVDSAKAAVRRTLRRLGR